jgi:hypothetical protein
MWAAFWDALQEVGGRRIVIALFVLALVVGLLFNRAVHFEKLGNVDVLYMGSANMGPWAFGVPAILGGVTFAAGMIWLNLVTLTAVPQFVAMLDKGWRELTFSKATPRWQLLLARYFSLLLLFYVLVITSSLPLALRLWWFTGVSTLNVLGSGLIQMFILAALLSAAALASMVAAGSGGIMLPIAVSVGCFVFSSILFDRRRILYEYVTSDLGREALEWAYNILPKCFELQNAAQAFVRSSTLPTSWPLWTTGLFALVMMSFALWWLERKSF